LLDSDDFKISAPKCPTHYFPRGNGDVLEIVVLKDIKLSNVMVFDILHLDNLPIVFHILDHVITTTLSEPFEKIKNRNGFKA
jgi:hypothetical protein